ncbi:MAG: ribbon-helix-helix protein, CopG family [Acidobacteriaceae bacterium]
MQKKSSKTSAKARARKIDPVVSVAYRAPQSILARLDQLAASKGLSRNAAISVAVSRLLEAGI